MWRNYKLTDFRDTMKFVLKWNMIYILYSYFIYLKLRIHPMNLNLSSFHSSFIIVLFNMPTFDTPQSTRTSKDPVSNKTPHKKNPDKALD